MARARRSLARKMACEDDGNPLSTVLHKGRRQSLPHNYLGPTVIHVVDGGDAWSAYLKRMTSRPGWTVARLSKESHIARSSIYKWITDGASAITIDSVYRVADALGDDRANALRAAGNLPTDHDPEVDLILSSNLSEREKAAMIDRLMQRREEERQRRIDDLRFRLGEEPEAS